MLQCDLWFSWICNNKNWFIKFKYISSEKYINLSTFVGIWQSVQKAVISVYMNTWSNFFNFPLSNKRFHGMVLVICSKSSFILHISNSDATILTHRGKQKKKICREKNKPSRFSIVFPDSSNWSFYFITIYYFILNPQIFFILKFLIYFIYFSHISSLKFNNFKQLNICLTTKRYCQHSS